MGARFKGLRRFSLSVSFVGLAILTVGLQFLLSDAFTTLLRRQQLVFKVLVQIPYGLLLRCVHFQRKLSEERISGEDLSQRHVFWPLSQALKESANEAHYGW